jgi:GH43 family beta-xylosidase
MPINEGPAILKRSGRIFVIYSASTTWSEDYCLGMLTADENADLMDAASWTKSPAPVFRKCAENRVMAPGHNSFCAAEDGDWIVYHAIDGPGGEGDLNTSKRSPRIQRVNWGADGAPDFGVPVPCGVEIIV